VAGSGPRRRIGIFGGTFDPVHVGHLVAAVNARHCLSLDKVLLVVANRPWQKVADRPVAPARDRLATVEAAVAGVEGLEASAIEIERGGDSYTADTVAELAAAHPADQLFLIVGSDLVGQMASWERVGTIKELVTVAVVSRPGWPGPPDLGPGWAVEQVEIPALDISSTELRARLADGRPLDFLVPAEAVRCMRERGMYAVAG